MSRKSGNRFCEKGHAQTKALERDDDSKKSHPALTNGRSSAYGAQMKTRQVILGGPHAMRDIAVPVHPRLQLYRDCTADLTVDRDALMTIQLA